MKKVLFVLFGFLSLTVHAQIFNHKTLRDKFDDVIFDKDIKTLIQRNDSVIIIEEKGQKPVKYIVAYFVYSNSMGSKDEIVNLVENVYGYQECWSVVKEQDVQDVKTALLSAAAEEDESKRIEIIAKIIDDYCMNIVHRVVTTQYSHQFKSEYYWIENDKTGDRTIYSNI